MPAGPDKMVGHKHKRRVFSFQIRREQSEDTEITNVSVKHFEAPHKALSINFSIGNIMPADACARCTAALKNNFGFFLITQDGVRFKKLDRQKGNLIQRFYFPLVDSKHLHIIMINTAMLRLVFKHFKGGSVKIAFSINGKYFLGRNHPAEICCVFKDAICLNTGEKINQYFSRTTFHTCLLKIQGKKSLLPALTVCWDKNWCMLSGKEKM